MGVYSLWFLYYNIYVIKIEKGGAKEMKCKCFDFDAGNYEKIIKINTDTLIQAYAKCCNCEMNTLCSYCENIELELEERGEY